MDMNKQKPKKSRPATVKDKAIRATLDLAAERAWNGVSLNDIAKKAKISLADLHEHFDDRADILTAWGRMLDRRILDKVKEPDNSLSPRERLFDLLMERFDMLNEERDAVLSILSSFCPDPKQAVIALPHLAQSMTWMLEAAGIETTGLRGAVRVAGLTGLYLKTLWVWKSDDSADMPKTMAELDKNLERVERWAGMISL